MKASTLTEYAAFVGIDWADRKHDVCLQPAGCDTREFSVLPHCAERIAQWAQMLRQRFEGRPIAVCLELRKGPLVSALQPYDFLVLFPVNPTTLAKYREAFCLSHVKDDPTDAELALELLMAHRDRLTALHPQSIAMRTLQRLVEQRRTLVADKERFTNRLTDALKQYFPQVLEWFKDKDTVVFCDFLTRWPTLKQAQQARQARLIAFFHEHNVRYPHLVAERLQAILQATPLTFDAGVIVPNRLLVEVLVQQLRVVLQAIDRFDLEIAQLAPTLPDYALFSTLLGAGAVYAPRLLAAFANSASVIKARPKSRDTPASPSSLSAVATSAGCTGVYTAPRSCARRSWSGPPSPSRTSTGPGYSMSSSARRAPRTRPLCARWPSSGFESCTAAGKTVHGVKRLQETRVPRARPAPDGRQSGGTQPTESSRINRRFGLAPPLPMTSWAAMKMIT